MRKLSTNSNVDLSDLVNYPDGRLRNNTGTGNGTPVNERVYGDLHQTIAKLLRLYDITANNLPDNEVNGFQIVEALVALASKNDYVIPLSLNTGVLSVPIKIGKMKEGEAVICQSGFNLTTETEIKGSDTPVFTVTFQGSFKTNENVRLIKTSAGVTLVRLADHYSLEAMNTDLFFLKKASQAEENLGAIDTAGTTPQTNLLAFTRRVIGIDSDIFLATLLRNGLYPKEHFAIVSTLNLPKNIGYFTGFDIGMAPGSLTVSGDIVSAVTSNLTGQDTVVTVTMDNAMADTNYYVRTFVQGVQSNMDLDNDVACPIFQPVSTTVFKLAFRDLTAGTAQNLRVHMEVVQIL